MKSFDLQSTTTEAQESSNAIERIFIAIRHLFNRGHYKPTGLSGKTLREALLTLSPEIYGTIKQSQVELGGMHYILERLPEGIESCRYIKLTNKDHFLHQDHTVVVAKKRRRDCYRINTDTIHIEITRGRSELYDILTHLTFMYMEADKIKNRMIVLDNQSLDATTHKPSSQLIKWGDMEQLTTTDKQKAVVLLSKLLQHDIKTIEQYYTTFALPTNPNKLVSWVSELYKCSLLESQDISMSREIFFTPKLQKSLGHHLYSEHWAKRVKSTLAGLSLLDRPLHIISANMHSIQNYLYAKKVFSSQVEKSHEFEFFEQLSTNKAYQEQIKTYALQNGMTYLKDQSSTHIDVQIFDMSKYFDNQINQKFTQDSSTPVLLVFDYAFGEQAYEVMDELLKPLEGSDKRVKYLNVASISVMGKAGILKGEKGDIMLADSHILEGSSGNYPFENELKVSDFNDSEIKCYKGSMVTVLGTSLQNKKLLEFFMESTWGAIGLDMEGAHYQKAIQAASKIRKSISKDVKVRYAYYASDNPMKTGNTLASGGLGVTGVKPTYLITQKIISQILEGNDTFL